MAEESVQSVDFGYEQVTPEIKTKKVKEVFTRVGNTWLGSAWV